MAMPLQKFTRFIQWM